MALQAQSLCCSHFLELHVMYTQTSQSQVGYLQFIPFSLSLIHHSLHSTRAWLFFWLLWDALSDWEAISCNKILFVLPSIGHGIEWHSLEGTSGGHLTALQTKTEIKKESCNCSNLPWAWLLLVNGEEYIWLVVYALCPYVNLPRLPAWWLKVSLLGLRQPYLLHFYRDCVFWLPPSQVIPLCHQWRSEGVLQLRNWVTVWDSADVIYPEFYICGWLLSVIT